MVRGLTFHRSLRIALLFIAVAIGIALITTSRPAGKSIGVKPHSAGEAPSP